ncbi:MAG: hypothetical protein CFH41_00796 [Alphaproteobacteria bacterium MarineAlpha11_Bin1]|nr:MAG: hypothetical protein CFH41_00796 [Alphaproteobacteria bacterium MarineAlpha11_Bin1]|tara:strand:- start:276 stop:542 length:267 start_codon:yes stop_codon:yes gene_type:complete
MAIANTVIFEDRKTALYQPGNIRVSGCIIFFRSAGEIYSGKIILPEGSTVSCDSVGVAILDVTAAKLACDFYTCKRTTSETAKFFINL